MSGATTVVVPVEVFAVPVRLAASSSVSRHTFSPKAH
jgi:hypothetical protein